MPATPWSVREAPLPTTLDNPADIDVRTYLAAHALERDDSVDTWGWDDTIDSPAHRLDRFSRDPLYRRVLLVAEPSDAAGTGDVVGYAFAELPLADNTHMAEAELTVAPAHRRTGIGSLLLDALEDVLRADGRTHLIIGSSQVGEPDDAGEDVLVPPTGVGHVLADAAPVAFLAARGFTLEQAMRYSVLPLPQDATALAAALDPARDAAGPDYTVLTWEAHAPEEHLDGFATLRAAMSTDVPLGDLAIEPEVWDGARVRAAEDVFATSRTCLTAAVLHVPTGELAGYTTIQVPHDNPAVAFQHDTLVRTSHRGHRLGMLLKAVNLARLGEAAPQARRIHTWNACENRHMLAVNEALGFGKVGLVVEWQKLL